MHFLDAHLSKLPIIPCLWCDKKFPVFEDLMHHVMQDHRGIKQQHLENATAARATKKQLGDYLNVTKKDVGMECPVCFEMFSKIDQLQKHSIKEHNRVLKPKKSQRGKNLSKLSPENLLKITMLSAYQSVKFHQGLIDEWNDPKDAIQRAAVLILKIHQMYGREAFEVFKMLQNKCKHPKKMRDLRADGIVYCMDCNADLTESEIMSTKNPTSKRIC